MSPIQLLTFLELMGVQVSIGHNDQLNILGSESVLSDGVIAQLKKHKADLVRILSESSFDAASVREALQFVCHGLAVAPETLIQCYFTADDLEDIRAGRYPDLVALRSLIKSDLDYPFSMDGSKTGRQHE